VRTSLSTICACSGTTGFHEREGPWYVVEYDLIDMKTEQETQLGRLDWADWDSNGDLLFAREGRLYRERWRICATMCLRTGLPHRTSRGGEVASEDQ
jgi:hypothetical protein